MKGTHATTWKRKYYEKKKIISILLGAATMLNTFGYVFAGETEMR